MKSKFTYTGIRVKNLDESVDFYTGILAMKVSGRSKIEATKGETVTLLSEEGGPQLELNFYSSESKFATDYRVGEGIDHLAFQVEDLDKALSEAGRLGHPLALEVKSGSSRWAYITDPNGIQIELFS
jgi:catechol 2,3-dioxygenase-like lactoylglutathione lyase family enzyme